MEDPPREVYLICGRLRNRKPHRRSGSRNHSRTRLCQQSPGKRAAQRRAIQAQIAALETAAGLWARAFASAEVSGPAWAQSAITPQTLALIARDLIRRGESVHQIDVTEGELILRPVGSWDVRGPWREADWKYRLDLFGPSGNITRFLPAASVVHARYAIDPARPWLGISPLGWARHTGTLAANLELRLGEEAGAPVGSYLALPSDGGSDDDADMTSQLRADIAAAKGRQVLVETTASGFDQGKAGAPQKDYVPNRFGASPPDVLPTLRTDAQLAVLNACGVPPSLATDADGTSQRESWRRFVMVRLSPPQTCWPASYHAS